MFCQINLGTRLLDYEFKISTRSRRLRLSVRGNRLLVSAPRNLQPAIVEKFIRRHQDWILSKLSDGSTADTALIPGGSRTDYLHQREAARSLVKARLAYFNQFYHFNIGRVSIKNQTTRWGSCSRQGNLNFNYKIVTLPARLADYIIVHELCHLAQLNHSPAFWRLVAQQAPDYERSRRALRGQPSGRDF